MPVQRQQSWARILDHREWPVILRGSACAELGLVQRIYKVDCEERSDILKMFDDVFNGLGCDPPVPPVIHPPRKDKIKAKLNRMESLDVIEKQIEPTDWVNTMVTVVKPNKLQNCIYPQDLNMAIKRERYHSKQLKRWLVECQMQKYSPCWILTMGFGKSSLMKKVQSFVHLIHHLVDTI